MCLKRLMDKLRNIMTDPRDFLINTDYELDKIVLAKSGNFISTTTFQHGLSFTPLIFGVWSTDENFESVNPLGISSSSSEYGYNPPLGVDCRASNSEIKLTARGDGHDSTKIYYRVFGFEPPSLNQDAPTTSTLANTFMLNSDYNYRKTLATGEFTYGGQSYTHNLGYIPQVMAWEHYRLDIPVYSDDVIMPLLYAEYEAQGSPYDFRLIVTPTQISIPNDFPFQLIDKVIWKIYYDEA